ncbi:hypothetical protein [Xanthocytophaga flava]|uniref:hypothetical protein n=1 Tax=Xanthocytophaga flava TaxID=3048013 RepID=UPI0028D663BE|nr:hypothetical protein [Xanthocytophaga flavus]MDJ1470268.1 hypothetical protein [Xanthocytophaga flavus]
MAQILRLNQSVTRPAIQGSMSNTKINKHNKFLKQWDATQPPQTLDILLKTLLSDASQAVNEEITLNRFLAICTINKVTWHRRMSDPKKFTMEEIELVANALNQLSQLTTNPRTFTSVMVFESIKTQYEAGQEIK